MVVLFGHMARDHTEKRKRENNSKEVKVRGKEAGVGVSNT